MPTPIYEKITGTNVVLEKHLDFWCVGDLYQRKDGTRYYKNGHWTDNKVVLTQLERKYDFEKQLQVERHIACPKHWRVRPELRVREQYEIQLDK